jgi:hypothetical protein
MPYIDMSVNVDLDNFDDDDLIEELEERGYTILSESEENNQLTDIEIGAILTMCARGKPGTIEYEIYEKLRKR